MADEQKITESVLKEALERITHNMAVFGVISRNCQNYMPSSSGKPGCNRRYNKTPAPNKFCDWKFCPLLEEN